MRRVSATFLTKQRTLSIVPRVGAIIRPNVGSIVASQNRSHSSSLREELETDSHKENMAITSYMAFLFLFGTTIIASMYATRHLAEKSHCYVKNKYLTYASENEKFDFLCASHTPDGEIKNHIEVAYFFSFLTPADILLLDKNLKSRIGENLQDGLGSIFLADARTYLRYLKYEQLEAILSVINDGSFIQNLIWNSNFNYGEGDLRNFKEGEITLIMRNNSIPLANRKIILSTFSKKLIQALDSNGRTLGKHDNVLLREFQNGKMACNAETEASYVLERWLKKVEAFIDQHDRKNLIAAVSAFEARNIHAEAKLSEPKH